MSYQGGGHTPESYGKNDTQAFTDIASVENFSAIVTPELARLEALRSNFKNSCLILSDYADSIKLYAVVDNINRFPEIGDKNIQTFHRYVSYMIRSNDQVEPLIAANVTTNSIAEMAHILRTKTFGESDYLEPTAEDIMDIMADYRGYDEHDNDRITRSASSVYADFLSHNMNMYVTYIARSREVRGSRKRGDYLSNIQKNLSKHSMRSVDGYLFNRDFRNSNPGAQDE